MRCSNCGYELGAKSPPPGESASCPRCGSSVAGAEIPFVGVEPLPPLRGKEAFSGYAALATRIAKWLVVASLGAGFLYLAIDGAHPKPHSNRSSCMNNLKQLAIALHNYHATYKALPAQSITDENGRPMHSWRVAILPFLDQMKLHDAYDFEQPWDSPHNREVCERYIDSFRCPGVYETGDEEDALTHYFVVSGDETMFGPDRWTKFSQMTDGLSNTIMIVECNSPDFRVKWYEPRDIPFDEMEFKLNPPEGIGVSSPHRGGAHVAFADGSVRSLSDGSIGEPAFRYLLIRNDGMPVKVP